MTHKEAIKTVINAAIAHASGHEHAYEIHLAVRTVQEILKVAQQQQQQTKRKNHDESE